MTPQERLEAVCRGALQTAPRSAVAWYLMASFMYYHRNISLISDAFYDYLGATMRDHWPVFEGHRHAHLITPEDLAAGTLYRHQESDYPTITRDTAYVLAKSEGLL